MAIKFHPDQGTILVCDFHGMIDLEMCKRRPVIVLSPKMKSRTRLCTVVPLSTTDPNPVMPFHYRLTTNPVLPAPYDSPAHWVKGDMLYTVSFDRLNLLFKGKDLTGKRIYDIRVIDRTDLIEIQKCVLQGIGLAALTQHI